MKNKFPLNNCPQEEISDEDKEEVEAKPDENIPQNTKSLQLVNLDEYSVLPSENTLHVKDFDYSDDESGSDDELEDDDAIVVSTTQPLFCLPLYSQLPKHKQSLVFKDPPPGCRLCIIATNVAETSLTIPNIKYVVDTGKIKNKVYDNVTGISTFIIQWTSKASADQRAGRAGRTSAGHCYRLYSSAVFNDQFKKHTDPEILSKPIGDFLLQMKAIGINVRSFPFPTFPNVESLISAEQRLVTLGALEKITLNKKKKLVTETCLTTLGKMLSYFPISPRYSKILLQAHQSKLVPQAVAIISGLTVQEIFTHLEHRTSNKKLFYSNPNCLILGDLMVILIAIATANEEGLSALFCERVGLRLNAMEEINKLRTQLTHYVNKIFDVDYTLAISLPNAHQIKLLRKIFLCGFGDHVAKRVPFEYEYFDENDPSKAKKKLIRNCYQSIEVEKQVYISAQSALFNETPEYVIYQEIFESNESEQNSKLYMRNVFVIDEDWLPVCVKQLCDFSNPLDAPPPRYDFKSDAIKCHRSSTFGPYNWKLPPVEVDYPDGHDRYRQFAHFLFNGDVVKSLSKNVKYLTIQPNVFVKPWSYIKPQVDKVMKCLVNNKISSRQALLDKWKGEPKCNYFERFIT